MELAEDRTGASSPSSLTSTTQTQNRGQLSPEALAVIARSLVISPDLDALLEHEDRSRAQKIVTATAPELKSGEAQLPLGSGSPTFETPAGLPPPPRRTRYGKPTRTIQEGEGQSITFKSGNEPGIVTQEGQVIIPKSPVHSLSSSVSNPYINPAPDLEEILRTTGDMMVTNENEVSLTQTRTKDTLETLQQEDQAGDELPKTLSNEMKQRPRVEKLRLLGKIHGPSKKKERPVERSTITFDPPRQERAYGVKPPIPQTPKPLFSRAGLRLSRHSSPRGSRSPPPDIDHEPQLPVRPLTTNFLDLEERADLVRKSRKLARVFGQTPDADIMAQQESGRSIHVHIFGKGNAPGGDSTRSLNSIRRHSMPLSPDDISFLSIVSPTNQLSPILPEPIIEIQGVAEPVVSLTDDTIHHQDLAPTRSSPPTSFIDLSEDAPDRSTTAKPRHSRSNSQSTFDTTTTSLNDPEDDRRRKRERLAKLHRFLGSRVPVGLVLGIDESEDSLPPPVTKNASSEEEGSRKAWLSRRRSSSAASLVPSLDDLDRLRVELDDREK
ncbi:hypothetical protein CVT24_008658, partial [Panaeolus cyanescens]